jgi:TRAP-type C4-dicarboxylate transport system permease small subunit
MSRLIGRLDTVVAVAAAFIVAATATVTCVAVFFRSVVGASLPWPEELSGYALVWTSFLGAYLAVRDQRHVAFDLLIEKLPAHVLKVVATIGDLVVIGFFGLLIAESIRMIDVVGGTPLQTLDVPTGVFMAALPICGTAIVLALCFQIVARWRPPA